MQAQTGVPAEIIVAIVGRAWCSLYIGGRKKAEIVDRGARLERQVWDRDEAIAHFEAKGESWSAEEEDKFREPIRAQYEKQGNPYYATARLWDDGIIDPAGWFDAAGNPLPGTDQNGKTIVAPTPQATGTVFIVSAPNADHVSFYQNTLAGFVQNLAVTPAGGSDPTAYPASPWANALQCDHAYAGPTRHDPVRTGA